MKTLKTILILLFVLQATLSGAQADRGLQSGISELEVSPQCQLYAQQIASKPEEILFGLVTDEAFDIYFIVSDEQWMSALMAEGEFGICADIVTKDQFPCGRSNDLPNSQVRRGELTAPLYAREIRKRMIRSEGLLLVNIGSLPAQYRGKDYELNLLLLNGRSLCHYQNFFDIPTSRWQLLDTGLFIDTVASVDHIGTITSIPDEISSVLSKKMKFTIPFEKGKATYSSKDIQPLYDSLRLTDFTILSAKIDAYSSVEGSTEANMTLQQKRAESILQALSSFQLDDIETEIHCAENWVEFIRDMNAKGDRSLIELSKSEVKEKLDKGGLARSMEHILKDHRKAILVLELEKKSKYKSLDSEVVLNMYEESLLAKNIRSAIELQQELFSRVENNTMPLSLVTSVDVPKEVDFGPLLNNNAAFKYRMDKENVLTALLAFQELEYLLPDDVRIKYNLCVLQTKAWLAGQATIEPNALIRNIDALKTKGIDYRLVNRLKINYQIIASEYYMQTGEYDKKDRALEVIYRKYKGQELSGQDLLRIAKYFSSYQRYDRAEEILSKEAVKVGGDEDLLFYYLSLKLIEPQSRQASDFRSIVRNASNANKRRFCEIFEPVNKGGVNFQLLEDDFLKETYCEVCK